MTTTLDPPPYGKLKPGPSQRPPDVATSQRARIFGAMIEIVGEHGYGAVKVRDVVRLAEVSSRSFYRHFDSKEDCFVQAYEGIVSRARTGLLSTEIDVEDWQARPRQVFAAFVRELKEDPTTARFALVDIYSGSPAALEKARLTEANFVSMVSESFNRSSNGLAVPQLVVEGMMAGVVRVARRCLLAGAEKTLPDLEAEMMAWVLSFPSEAAAELADLDRGVIRGTAPNDPRPGDHAGKPADGDRSAILAAVSKLASAEDYAYKDLSVPRIRAAAGLSRKKFDAQFAGVEECFLAALDQRAGIAIADAATEQMAGAAWEGGVYRGISSLCNAIARDPVLARVGIQDDFGRDSKGSRARQDLIAAVAAQIRASVPPDRRGTDLAMEASAGAIWALFHHHVLRDWVIHRPEIAATLAYMALAPVTGPDTTVAAIRREQVA